MHNENSIQNRRERIDRILQRGAWCAQILLFMAAIVGYFWTVRPVYQKQLLEEQIAERTVRLRETTLSLQKLKGEESKLKHDNARLAKEGSEAYAILSNNLLQQLKSVPSVCLYEHPQITGTKLLDCVKTYVQDNITTYLRPQDKNAVEAALNMHSNKILSLRQVITSTRAARLKEDKIEVARLKTDIVKNEQQFLGEIRRLRSNDLNHSANVQIIKDIGQLRSAEERNAFEEFLKARHQLKGMLSKAQYDESVAGYEWPSEENHALTNIMVEVSDSIYKKLNNQN